MEHYLNISVISFGKLCTYNAPTGTTWKSIETCFPKLAFFSL